MRVTPPAVRQVIRHLHQAAERGSSYSHNHRGTTEVRPKGRAGRALQLVGAPALRACQPTYPRNRRSTYSRQHSVADRESLPSMPAPSHRKCHSPRHTKLSRRAPSTPKSSSLLIPRTSRKEGVPYKTGPSVASDFSPLPRAHLAPSQQGRARLAAAWDPRSSASQINKETINVKAQNDPDCHTALVFKTPSHGFKLGRVNMPTEFHFAAHQSSGLGGSGGSRLHTLPD